LRDKILTLCSLFLVKKVEVLEAALAVWLSWDAIQVSNGFIKFLTSFERGDSSRLKCINTAFTSWTRVKNKTDQNRNKWYVSEKHNCCCNNSYCCNNGYCLNMSGLLTLKRFVDATVIFSVKKCLLCLWQPSPVLGTANIWV